MTITQPMYRIEKHRIAVALTLRGGDTLRGDVFVEASPYGTGQERAVDLLNAPEPLFPLILGDGSVMFVARDAVAEVTGEGIGEVDEYRMASARRVPLEITLGSGAVHAGWVLSEMPSGRARGLDYLNSLNMRFITLYDDADGGARLLNTRHIERVRPRE